MFARAVSFFNAALKTQEKFGLQLRSVPARATSFNTNERYVCTCCKFWYQRSFNLHKLWVLAISVLDFKLEFLFCHNSVLVLFTKKQGQTFTFFNSPVDWENCRVWCATACRGLNRHAKHELRQQPSPNGRAVKGDLERWISLKILSINLSFINLF